MDIEQQINRNLARHEAADNRYALKLETAERMIGILCRNGKNICYVSYTTKSGRFKTFEGSWIECMEKALKLI
jgi:hypothetical protein